MNQNGLGWWRVRSFGPFQSAGGEFGGLVEFGLKGDDASKSPFNDFVLVPQSLPGDDPPEIAEHSRVTSPSLPPPPLRARIFGSKTRPHEQKDVKRARKYDGPGLLRMRV